MAGIVRPVVAHYNTLQDGLLVCLVSSSAAGSLFHSGGGTLILFLACNRTRLLGVVAESLHPFRLRPRLLFTAALSPSLVFCLHPCIQHV
jgi:hypothetical protein